MKVHVIGSGWAVPSDNRSKTSILLRDKSDLLFDCGGDVAKAFKRFGVSLKELDALFLSHKHIDHISGLPSLLHAMWLDGREEPFPIYSNADTLKHIKELLDLHGLLEKLDIEFFVLYGEGHVEEFGVSYCEVNHQIESTAYRYKDISYSGDTEPSDAFIDLAEDSKLLIHEGTYPSGQEREAHKNGHSTVRDAVNVLDQSNSDNLAIIHVSPLVDIDEEGKKVNEDVFFPQDYSTYRFE